MASKYPMDSDLMEKMQYADDVMRIIDNDEHMAQNGTVNQIYRSVISREHAEAFDLEHNHMSYENMTLHKQFFASERQVAFLQYKIERYEFFMDRLTSENVELINRNELLTSENKALRSIQKSQLVYLRDDNDILNSKLRIIEHFYQIMLNSIKFTRKKIDLFREMSKINKDAHQKLKLMLKINL